MRTPSRRSLLRHGIVLCSFAFLAAAGSGVCAGEFRTWEVQRPAGMKRSSLAFRLVLDQPGPGTLKLQGPGLTYLRAA